MLLLASSLFLVLAPGTVALYVPWLLTKWRPGPVPPGADAVRVAGLSLTIVSCVVLLEAFWRFAWVGRGSPAPVLPPEALVVSGFYRYVRNPMYLAVLCIVTGQAIWLWRLELVAYAAVIGVAFHLFVTFYEEPTLRAQFGESYDRYCRQVRRWVPRLTPLE